MQRDEAVKRCGERALCSGRVAERDEQARVHVDPVGRGLPEERRPPCARSNESSDVRTEAVSP